MAVNDDLLDKQIMHQIHVLRLSKGITSRMLRIMERAEADMIGKLMVRLERIKERGFDTGPVTTRRLRAAIESMTNARKELFEKMGTELRGELEAFAEYERDWQLALLGTTVATVQLATNTPSLARIRAAALSRPFQGRILREWVKDLEADDARRLRRAIQIGFVEGETTAQIISRVKGLAISNFGDGEIAKSKRHIATIVRTAVNHTANRARDAITKANLDLIKSVQWVSTLDGRTSAVCRARDGKIYPPESGPRPPAHPNCRSLTVDILKGVPGNTGTRASFNGQVPADLTYNDWLRKQPRSFVEEVLGKTKATLYLKGKLDLSKFVDRSGREYNLEELRRREPQAFREAG